MNTSGFGKASMIRARIALMEVSAREDGDRLEVLHRPLEEAILAAEERLKSLPSDDEEAPWVSSIVEDENAVANYWKHRDEWTSIDWTKLARQSKDTAARVQVAGIQPTSTGNLRTAAKVFGVVTYHDLEPIRVCARAWAEKLVTLAKSECESA